MRFEEALRQGDLDAARASLDESTQFAETSRLHLPECFADLAHALDRQGRHDDAIEAMQRAIDAGWESRPHALSDVAEFHLRAGRGDEAAATWAQLKADEPDDVWLCNAAGLSYSEIGEHELAVAWLGDGLEVALRSGDPERVAAQLSDVRRKSLQALGRKPDELEQRVDAFLEQRSRAPRDRNRRLAVGEAPEDALPSDHAADPTGPRGREIAVALAWFPAGEYDRALDRWASLAEDWAGVAHDDYCHRMDGHIKWLRGRGVQVRAVAPIVVDDYVAFCQERGEDPENARARYAAHRFAGGHAIPWPPGRNEPCWCGSQRKYKKCCGPAPAAPMHQDSE